MSRKPDERQADLNPVEPATHAPSSWPPIPGARLWSDVEIDLLRARVRRLERYQRVARLFWWAWKHQRPAEMHQACTDYETLRMGG
jgi:hypothetical protein